MELCGWCHKQEGVHQLYRMESDGEKYPTRKLCDDCWRAFRTPSKKLQKILKRDGFSVDVPCKPMCVLTKDGVVVSEPAESMSEWLCAGFRIIGVADTTDGVKRLQAFAKRMSP